MNYEKEIVRKKKSSLYHYSGVHVVCAAVHTLYHFTYALNPLALNAYFVRVNFILFVKLGIPFVRKKYNTHTHITAHCMDAG